jgi:hypothetical protein
VKYVVVNATVWERKRIRREKLEDGVVYLMGGSKLIRRGKARGWGGLFNGWESLEMDTLLCNHIKLIMFVALS